MKIECNFDTTLLERTAQRYEKNLAYSTAQALRQTALEAQSRIRAQLRQRFQIRKPEFMDRTIKIFAWPSVNQQRIYAEIGVDNSKRGLLLPIFETGGTKTPVMGKNVGVPITGSAARPSFGSPVSPAFTFRALNFHRGSPTQEGRKILAARRAKGIRKRRLGGQYYIWLGNNRTFILTSTKRAPNGGVFQRVGPGRDDIRLIYSFKPNVRLKKALDFVETSRATYEEIFGRTLVAKFYRLGL